FVQHHLTESGHTDLLVTQKLSQPTNYSTATEVAAAAQRLSSNGLAFTNFLWRTFHLDKKSPSRTHILLRIASLSGEKPVVPVGDLTSNGLDL
ncbi:MAG: hypothetical protein WCA10_14135, partial [Terracidiphilus sp.]